MNEGHIFTEGQIQADYPDLIAAQLSRIGDVKRIVHHVSTPGGHVLGGYKGYHKLVDFAISRQIPIDTIVEEAQSMGSFVMLASDVTGGKIKVLTPGRVMIHYPKFDMSGAGMADSDSLESGAKELRIIENEMADVYAASMAKRGKAKPVEEIKALMKKETYMSAQMAVDLGFADEAINYIDKSQDQKLKAVALGLPGDKVMSKDKNVWAKIMDVIKAEVMDDPKTVDIMLKEGGTLSVEGDAAVVGAGATVEGKPAEGSYINDATGETIICVAGKITAITPPAAPTAPPQETEAQRLAKELETVKAQLAQKAIADEAAKVAEQQKIAAEQVKVAEAEKERVAVALAAKEKELEELKKITVGDKEKQFEGHVPNRAAFALGSNMNEQTLKIKATRTHLADNLPWLERFYPNGKFSDGTRFADYRTGGAEAVSILETNLNYTWNGVLSTDLFFKPTLDTPALSDVFTIDLGAADKKVYHIAPTFDKVTKPYTGCAQAPTGSSYDITSKAIQLKPFEMYEGWCKDDFTNQLTGSYNVLAQEWLKTGTASFDPAGTPIDRIIIDGLKDAMRRDLWRRSTFADTSSTSADWNQIDGLFTTLRDQSGASNYCVYVNKSNFGSVALSADAAYNELVSIWNNSSRLLKQRVLAKRNGKFLVTRSIWDNLYSSYTAVGAVTELAFKQASDGINGELSFRGMPLQPMDIWDEHLADATNPHYGVRHIIILTVKENHILGVENTADLEKIDSWFEKKDNKRYYRSNFSQGVLGAIHCDLTTISY